MRPKILYVYQFFKTPAEGGIIRSYYLSSALVEEGYAVEVITSHNGASYLRKEIDGITVHYVPLRYEQSFGTLRRLYVYSVFVAKAIRCALSVKGVRICYVASVPLTVGFIGLAMKWVRQVPYYFEVGDLWPLTPIQMGYFRNRFLQRMLYGLEEYFYRHADKIVALSPAIQTNIQQRIADPEKVVCIPNIADCEFFYPETKDVNRVREWGLEGKTVVTYFGSVGKVVRLEALIRIAQAGRNDPGVRFLVAGEGSELERLKQEAAGLDNIRFLGHLGKEELKQVLNVTDIVYLSYLSVPALETNSPNKLFESLAAGKLCVINIRGWHCDLIEEEGCGFYADPSSPACFFERLQPYRDDPGRLRAASERARQLAETRFSRRQLSGEFAALFRFREKENHADASLAHL